MSAARQRSGAPGLALDAGALIALERNDRGGVALLETMLRLARPLVGLSTTCARARGYWVATSDPGDLRRLDPRIPLLEV